MNHNFDPHELERLGQSINQSNKQQAIQAVSLTLLRLTLRSNKDTYAPSIRMHRYCRMKINT
jgi:hypothetical protein